MLAEIRERRYKAPHRFSIRTTRLEHDMQAHELQGRMQKMAEYCEYLVKSVVPKSHRETLRFDHAEHDNHLLVKVGGPDGPDTFGRIRGRGGSVITAIERVAKAAGSLIGVIPVISVREDEKDTP